MADTTDTPEKEVKIQKLYLCKKTCFDGKAFYEQGKKYPIDVTRPYAKHFDIPEAAAKALAEEEAKVRAENKARASKAK